MDESGGDLLSDAVAEELLIAPGAHVVERQNDDCPRIERGACACLAHLARRAGEEPKRRAVASLRNLDHHGIVPTLVGVVLAQLCPQAPRLYANDSVDPRIELLTTVENLDRQGVFLEPAGTIGDALSNDERKEAAQALRATEGGAAQNAPKRFLGLFPSWSGRLRSGYLRIGAWMRGLGIHNRELGATISRVRSAAGTRQSIPRRNSR